MLTHSFLIFIFLLSSPNIFCDSKHIHESLTSPTKLKLHPLLSSERRGDTFAVVDYQDHKYDDDTTIMETNLRIENWKNHTVKECTYSTEVRYPNLLRSSSRLVRLKGIGDRVVLAWDDHDGNPTAIVMDFFNCFMTFLGPQGARDTPIVVPTNDGGLDLFVSDRTFCEDAGKSCLVKYNSYLQVVGRPKPVNVDLSWSTVRVERLHNGNYLIRGLDDRFTYYKVLLVDSSTGEQTNLLSLDYRSHHWFDLVASGSSFCWIYKPLVDKTLYCSQFNNEGQLIFNNSVKFDVPVKPLLMHVLADGELLVLGFDILGSTDVNRWNLKWAKVSQIHDETEFGYIPLNCTADSVYDLVVYDVWKTGGRTYLGYACQNADHYVYDVASF